MGKKPNKPTSQPTKKPIKTKLQQKTTQMAITSLKWDIMTRSDLAVLRVGDTKHTVATQKVTWDSHWARWHCGSTVCAWTYWVQLFRCINISSLSCTLRLLPCNVMGSDHVRKYEENSLIHFHNICLGRDGNEVLKGLHSSTHSILAATCTHLQSPRLLLVCSFQGWKCDISWS